MICLVNGEQMLYSMFKDIPENGLADLGFCFTKPTTLVLDRPKGCSSFTIAEDQSVGVRMVKRAFCYKLMERMKKPLVSTSNISGEPTPKSF